MDGDRTARRQALRTAGRDARAQVVGEVRRLATATIVQRLATLPEVRAAHRVLLTHPVGDELDLTGLLELLHLDDVVVSLPRVRGEWMEVVDHPPGGPLVAGWQGVSEPTGPPTREPIDVVVVPALAVDARGNRLGYGGGHFDRLLADRASDAVSVGAVLHAQLVDEVPAEPHDVPLDVVVTERGVWRPHAQRAAP